MIIELAGVPGGGKSTLAAAYAATHPKSEILTLSMHRRLPESWYLLRYALRHPLSLFEITRFVFRHHAPGLGRYTLHLALRACAKYEKARVSSSPIVILDEGILHLLVVVPGKPVSKMEMRRFMNAIPLPDAVLIASEGVFHRFHREGAEAHPRAAQGAEALSVWEEAVRENARALRAVLAEGGLPHADMTASTEANAEALSALARKSYPEAMTMRTPMKRLVIVGVFALAAFAGLIASFSAPYIKSDDELVYLTGALEAREGTLPDAAMLEGYEYGPYLYPLVMAHWYEPLGHYLFKSIYLVILIFATGLAAYYLFRTLGLAWIPSLLFSVAALLPRAAAGTEIFGAFTFREAIGREAAMPLFFFATALLLKRIQKGRSLWPVFILIGLFLFLHPVTVTLFAFIALIASGAALYANKTPLLRILRELILGGIAYVIAGFYFFIKVFERLAPSASEGLVSTRSFVDAILFRNAWEFPAASLDWYRHMLIISFGFLVLIALYLFLPYARRLRARFPYPGAKLCLTWGLTAAMGSLILALLIPGLNLYLMEHYDASYAFQQWSRISKFYYLGLFVALVPVFVLLWSWYKESRFRFRHALLALVFIGTLASSTYVFEIFQFAIGYKNYEKAYVPQAWSGVPDGITAADYREACSALASLGAKPSDQIMSNDFGLRYYCRADLYTTYEEGAAYTYRPRAEMVAWHDAFLAQRTALNTRDLSAMRAFAVSVGASYIVIGRNPETEPLLQVPGSAAASRHLILPVAPRAK